MIRTLRTTDLLRVLVDSRRIGPDWAQTWEKVGSQPGSALSPTAVARGLLFGREMERCNVLAEGTRLWALASVRARSGPRAWEVHCLSLSPGAEEEGIELLERLCVVAGDEGGERVFLRLPASSPVVKVARQAGFLPCLGETLYRKEALSTAHSSATRFVRPLFSSDEYGVFRLYCECVPSKVKSAYAIPFDEWRDAVEPWGNGERQGVYEAQECVRGWVRVASGKRVANRVELMVNSEEESGAWEDMVAWGVQQGRPNAPFLALVPDYQSTLAWVLEKKGFIPTGEYQVLVKSIAVRVKDSALAPAGA